MRLITRLPLTLNCPNIVPFVTEECNCNYFVPASMTLLSIICDEVYGGRLLPTQEEGTHPQHYGLRVPYASSSERTIKQAREKQIVPKRAQLSEDLKLTLVSMQLLS